MAIARTHNSIRPGLANPPRGLLHRSRMAALVIGLVVYGVLIAQLFFASMDPAGTSAPDASRPTRPVPGFAPR